MWNQQIWVSLCKNIFPEWKAKISQKTTAESILLTEVQASSSFKVEAKFISDEYSILYCICFVLNWMPK